MRGVKEGGAGTFGYVFDATLGLSVLMMGVDATESEALVGFENGGFENFGIEKAVVGMIMSDGDAVGCAYAFESELCFDGGIGVHVGHEVDVGEIREVIGENGGADVAFKGGTTTVRGDKAWCGADKLVYADDLARGGGHFEATVIFHALGAPRFAMSLAVSAAGAGWRVHVSEVGGNVT